MTIPLRKSLLDQLAAQSISRAARAPTQFPEIDLSQYEPPPELQRQDAPTSMPPASAPTQFPEIDLSQVGDIGFQSTPETRANLQRKLDASGPPMPPQDNFSIPHAPREDRLGGARRGDVQVGMAARGPAPTASPRIEAGGPALDREVPEAAAPPPAQAASLSQASAPQPQSPMSPAAPVPTPGGDRPNYAALDEMYNTSADFGQSLANAFGVKVPQERASNLVETHKKMRDMQEAESEKDPASERSRDARAVLAGAMPELAASLGASWDRLSAADIKSNFPSFGIYSERTKAKNKATADIKAKMDAAAERDRRTKEDQDFRHNEGELNRSAMRTMTGGVPLNNSENIRLEKLSNAVNKLTPMDSALAEVDVAMTAAAAVNGGKLPGSAVGPLSSFIPEAGMGLVRNLAPGQSLAPELRSAIGKVASEYQKIVSGLTVNASEMKRLMSILGSSTDEKLIRHAITQMRKLLKTETDVMRSGYSDNVNKAFDANMGARSGAAPSAPAPGGGMVRVIGPDGKKGKIAESGLQAALKDGFKLDPTLSPGAKYLGEAPPIDTDQDVIEPDQDEDDARFGR